MKPNKRQATIRTPLGDPKMWDMYSKGLREVVINEGATPFLADAVDHVMKKLFERAFPQGDAANISWSSEAEMLNELILQQQAVIGRLFEAAAKLAFMHLHALHEGAIKPTAHESGLSALWRRASKSFKPQQQTTGS